MEFTFRRAKALFVKEAKDLTKNTNVFLLCLLPIAFAFFPRLTQMDLPQMQTALDAFIPVMGLNLVVVSLVMASFIAEEKEKNTMRTLMLSSVSPWEFLVGKAALILIIGMVNTAAVFFIIGVESQFLAANLLTFFPVIITMTVIGGIIGLLVQNMMATGIVAMPVIGLFMFIPMLALHNEAMAKVSQYLPNVKAQEILQRVMDGQAVEARSIVIILAWIVLSVISFALIYKRKGLDG